MTLTDYKKTLDRQLTPAMALRGFEREALLEYCRSRPEIAHTLRFAARMDSGQCRIAGGAGIKIHGVEALLRPAESPRVTIAGPFHFFSEERRYFEWPMESVEEVGSIASSILELIDSHVIPVLEELSRPGALRELLAREQQALFALGRSEQIVVRAALEFLEGSKGRAISLLEDELERQHERPPKYWRSIKEALQRLQGLQRSAASSDGVG